MPALPPQPLSPLDGRYRAAVGDLADYLSEAGLNRARVEVEVEWLIALTDRVAVRHLAAGGCRQGAAARPVPRLRADRDRLAGGEGGGHAARCEGRRIPRARPADRPRTSTRSPSSRTSPARARTSTPPPTPSPSSVRCWRLAAEARAPSSTRCRELAEQHRDAPMLSRTHGQPATPTTMGKELAVFAWRLERVAAQVRGIRVPGEVLRRDRHLVCPSRRRARHRLAGAHAAGSSRAWASASTRSRRRSSRTTGRWSCTTACGMPAASCTISRPTCGPTSRSGTSRRSRWPGPPARRRCRTRSTRSASRTPRRTSRSRAACSRPWPATLVTSRLQRDLTDSTTQRNIGVGLGHSLLALDNLARGLGEISLAQPVLDADLEANWEVLAEAIQTVVRAEIAAGRSQISDPYALLKDLTRGPPRGRGRSWPTSSRASTSGMPPRSACSR